MGMGSPHTFIHPPYICTPPYIWSPLICLKPPHICMFPCTSVCVHGYLHVIWGIHPICWGLGGISTSVRLLVSVSTSTGCRLCFIPCTFLVVHYVSSLYYHGYDYYSSSDCGIFLYVIYIISDCGSLFDGASYNVGSA